MGVYDSSSERFLNDTERFLNDTECFLNSSDKNMISDLSAHCDLNWGSFYQIYASVITIISEETERCPQFGTNLT